MKKTKAPSHLWAVLLMCQTAGRKGWGTDHISEATLAYYEGWAKQCEKKELTDV